MQNSVFKLPMPSTEQINVVINADNNIVVNSVAGSGKTTTILHLAQTIATANPRDLILLLTYNKKLKLETRKKIELLKLRNIEAHSYHSAAVKYYDPTCYDDYRLINVVDSGETKLPSFNRIIIDEAQDMTELYYKFVCVIVRDLANRYLKFTIVGDKFQSIFNFNGADHRFIQYADVLFSPLTGIQNWITCKLSTSYRITNQMAMFLNKVILKSDRLQAIKNGPPVDYIVCNTFGFYPSQLVYQIISERRYKLDDIFILAPSVKSSKSPVRKVANYLSSQKLPVFVPGSDEEPLDEDVLKGKIVFSTLHQVKGLERKCVFLFGFDQSYFDFFAKNAPKDICPNTLYVGLTRSLERLVIFHHNHHDYLSFMNADLLARYASVQIKDKMHISSRTTSKLDIAVCELTRHISAKVIYDAMGFFSYADEVEPTNVIEIPIRIDGVSSENKTTLTETVAELNGIALASYFEYNTLGTLEILNELLKSNKHSETVRQLCTTENKDADRRSLDESSTHDYSFDFTPENLLKLSNAYCSYRSAYIFKMNQITNYNWLTQNQLDSAFERMKTYISKSCMFEVPVFSVSAIMGKNINGCIDILDLGNKTIWEIKAVASIKFEHIIQVAIYGYLFNEMLKSLECREKFGLEVDGLKYKLFNILNGHIIEVKFDQVCLGDMLGMLIHAKYFDNRTVEDDQFVMDLLAVNVEYMKSPEQKNKKTYTLAITSSNSASNSVSSAALKILDDVDSLF